MTLSLLGIGQRSPSPTVITPPILSGSLLLGAVLSITNGIWSGNPLSYTYQWLLNGNPIVGATSNTLTVLLALLGGNISVVVTAINDVGQNSITIPL